jgi:fumarate hydratase, class II
VNDGFRLEKGALCPVQVPAGHISGGQTERAREFPHRHRSLRARSLIHAFGILKQCAALANGELRQPPQEKVPLRVGSAQEVIDGAQ